MNYISYLKFLLLASQPFSLAKLNPYLLLLSLLNMLSTKGISKVWFCFYLYFILSIINFRVDGGEAKELGSSGIEIENEHLKVTFSGSSGLIQSVLNKDTKDEVTLKQEVYINVTNI